MRQSITSLNSADEHLGAQLVETFGDRSSGFWVFRQT